MISTSFSLDNFEGPLELLLCLIQKEEIDICQVAIKQLTLQMIEELKRASEVDRNSEMLSLTTTLLLLKSQKLLPQHSIESEYEEDPRIEIIQSLIEYSRVKEAAQALSFKEEQQRNFFPRALTTFRKELGSGLEEIDLEDLKSLLLKVIKKAEKSPQQIIEAEKWEVADKVRWLRTYMRQQSSLLFTVLFSEEKCREELVVLFLALLEMMKHQELKVVKENETLYIITPI